MAGVVLAAPLLVHEEGGVWSSRYARLEDAGLLTIFHDRTCEEASFFIHVSDMVLVVRDTDSNGLGKEICLDLPAQASSQGVSPAAFCADLVCLCD